VAKSTRKPSTKRPQKPYEGFPLFPHASGRWAKKIRQRLVYFGKTADDPEGEAALEKFNREWPYLKDGRTPPPVEVTDGCQLVELVNAFLTVKLAAVKDGELSERMFPDYHRICDRLLQYLGKDRRIDDLRPDDFTRLRSRLAKGRRPKTVLNDINLIRIVLRFAYDHRLIDKPVHFGQSFNRPAAKVLRRDRNQSGPRLFERDELLTILDCLDGKPVTIEGEDEPLQRKPAPDLRAIVLLALNAGFGNTDIADLPQSAVDFDAGWIDFPRVKTEIPRRVPLWPETVAALARAIEARPEPAERQWRGRCFLTTTGKPVVRMQERKDADGTSPKVRVDPLGQRFTKVLRRLKINGRRGLGLYTCRHVFETVAGESRDQPAVDSIMGHVDPSMAAVYRERISDERLQAVVESVRQWLFATEGGAK